MCSFSIVLVTTTGFAILTNCSEYLLTSCIFDISFELSATSNRAISLILGTLTFAAFNTSALTLALSAVIFAALILVRLGILVVPVIVALSILSSFAAPVGPGFKLSGTANFLVKGKLI